MRRAVLLVPLFLSVGQPREVRGQADVAGSSDHRLFPRVTGYVIASYRDADPIRELFRRGEGTERDTIEGRVTRFLYGLPRASGQEPTTQLGLVRHYELIVQRLGGTVLYRQPTYGYLHARLVRDGREFWLKVEQENLTEYNVAIAERSAPVQAATVALADGQAAGACPCAAEAPGAGGAPPTVPAAAAGRLLTTRAARQIAAAAARFALDTAWAITVLPSRGSRNGFVTIRGLRVEDATAVRFGDYEARVLTRGASAIGVAVPERPVGLTTVTVLSPAGARTARDSFLVYQEPVEDASTDLRIYTCTDPPARNAPAVTAFEPATVRTGDTLTIRGRRLDLPVYVAFTYHRSSTVLNPSPRDADWGSASILERAAASSTGAGTHVRYEALPVEQTGTTIRVVVPVAARTGPVALFGHGECVASEQSVGIRVGPAPR